MSNCPNSFIKSHNTWNHPLTISSKSWWSLDNINKRELNNQLIQYCLTSGVLYFLLKLLRRFWVRYVGFVVVFCGQIMLILESYERVDRHRVGVTQFRHVMVHRLEPCRSTHVCAIDRHPCIFIKIFNLFSSMKYSVSRPFFIIGVTSFPLLNVIALTCYLGFVSVLPGRKPSYLLIEHAIWASWMSNFFWWVLRASIFPFRSVYMASIFPLKSTVIFCCSSRSYSNIDST